MLSGKSAAGCPVNSARYEQQGTIKEKNLTLKHYIYFRLYADYILNGNQNHYFTNIHSCSCGTYWCYCR